MRKPVFGAVLMPLFLLAACAGNKAVQSGFLRDYNGVRPAARDGEHLQVLRPTAQVIARYRSVAIDPVTFYDQAPGELSEADQAALGRLFDEELRKALAGRFELLPAGAAPGPETLRITPAITRVSKANPTVNVLTTLALFLPVANGGLQGEVDVRDATSGDRVAALVWGKSGAAIGEFGGNFKKLAHARKKAAEFARVLAELLTRPAE